MRAKNSIKNVNILNTYISILVFNVVIEIFITFIDFMNGCFFRGQNEKNN